MLLSNERKVADMREAFGQTLVELGTVNSNLVCVGADTTDSLKTKKFGDKYPKRENLFAKRFKIHYNKYIQ